MLEQEHAAGNNSQADYIESSVEVPADAADGISLIGMITRREAAQRLDIPLQMAQRHGIPARLSEGELADINEHPPAWLVQSRANRTGKRPIWVQLRCEVCGRTEAARPKKWWPAFTFISCSHHSAAELPEPRTDMIRSEYEGVGSRFIGIVDVPVPAPGNSP